MKLPIYITTNSFEVDGIRKPIMYCRNHPSFDTIYPVVAELHLGVDHKISQEFAKILVSLCVKDLGLRLLGYEIIIEPKDSTIS